MIRTRFMVAATTVALAAGCAGAPTAKTAPTPDRQVAAAPTVKFTAADIEQMRKMLPQRLTEEQAQQLVFVDPSKIKTGDRQTQQFRRWGGWGWRGGWGGLGWGGWGRGLGFWPYTYGGLGLYWPYSWYGGYWNLYGAYPYATWGGLWSPYGYGWGGLW